MVLGLFSRLKSLGVWFLYDHFHVTYILYILIFHSEKKSSWFLVLFSLRCLEEHGWDYQKAGQAFLEFQVSFKKMAGFGKLRFDWLTKM